MDNYKIKVKDESSADEARDLFKKLGYHPDNSSYEPYVEWIAVFEDGSGSFYSHNMNLGECVEITIAQLRDLVVLKRNDVKDATHRDKQQNSIYLTSDKVIYYWDAEWLNSAINKSNDYENYIANSLTPITQPQDPALISGAEALRALADGKDVDVHEYTYKNEVWFNLKDTKFTPAEILAEKVRDKPYTLTFRLKPQTIKVELEIPAPYKAKIGGRDDTSFVLNVGRHQYLYQNEDDYTKARDALEAVFDSVVRGTNS